MAKLMAATEICLVTLKTKQNLIFSRRSILWFKNRYWFLSII